MIYGQSTLLSKEQRDNLRRSFAGIITENDFNTSYYTNKDNPFTQEEINYKKKERNK